MALQERCYEPGELPGVIDISKLDFEALAKRFATSQRKNLEIEQLKAAIRCSARPSHPGQPAA